MKDMSRRDFVKVVGAAAAGAFLYSTGFPRVLAQAPVIGTRDVTGMKSSGDRIPGKSVLQPENRCSSSDCIVLLYK